MENKQISRDHWEQWVPVILSAEKSQFLEYIVKILEFFFGGEMSRVRYEPQKCHLNFVDQAMSRATSEQSIMYAV
jgi:hypothetical protein